MEKILIGEIVNVIGIKGEVKVKSFAQSIDTFLSLEKVILSNTRFRHNNDLNSIDVSGSNSETDRRGNSTFQDAEFTVAKVRMAGEAKSNIIAILFDEINDRNAAESLVGAKLYMEDSELAPLPEDTYYVKDLIGLKVISFDDSKSIGIIKDVIQNTAQDIYVITTKEKMDVDNAYAQKESEFRSAKSKGKKEACDVMVPAVKEFIKEVNIREGYVKIHFIEGML